MLLAENYCIGGRSEVHQKKMEVHLVSVMHPVVSDRLFLCQGVDILPDGATFLRFMPEQSIRYYPLCDDFGPMNFTSIVKFIRQLDNELVTNPDCTFFYCVESCKRDLTNAVFLLGAYMIFLLALTVDEVSDSFSWLDRTLIEPYRDATFAEADFGLTLEDCWGGLAKGIEQGWVDLPSSPDEDYRWGLIDVDEYAHYDDPINGDLHEVVPGKFIAFQGPVDLGGDLYRDDERGLPAPTSCWAPVQSHSVSTQSQLVSTNINSVLDDQVGCLFQASKVTSSCDSSRQKAFWLVVVQI